VGVKTRGVAGTGGEMRWLEMRRGCGWQNEVAGGKMRVWVAR
jgi:hypothetical protein